LLLGGSGFVGRRLVQLLGKHGYDIRVPTRSRARSRALLVQPEVELLQADVHDEAVLAQLLHGCDAVINLIGILNEAGHRGAGFEHAHVALAAKLLRGCRQNGVTRLLQMSALKADAEHGPSHYLRTKGRAEQLIFAAGDEIAFTIFQPSVVFGPDDSFINRFASLLRRLPVLPLPCPNARFAPVFVDDVALAFATALTDSRTHGATYELCGPEIYSLEELVRLLRGWLNLHRLIIPLPDALGHLQAWVGEYLLPGKPLSLDNFASLGVASVCSTDGVRALGIEPLALSTIVPTYLGSGGYAQRLARLRQHAGRR
jgi:NADH dehydrogenase